MSSVVSVNGKSAFQRRDELDTGARSSSTSATPRREPAAVVVEDDDAIAHGLCPGDRVPAREDVVLIGSRAAGRRAGSTLEKPVRDATAPVATMHSVGASSRDELRCRLGAEPDVDRRLPELDLEVAGHPAELRAAGRADDQADLAAEAVLALEERDRVPALRERDGRLHAGRAAAGDDPAPRRLGRGEQVGSEARFAARRRIDRAGDRQALEDAADAALVAADAMDDLVLATVARPCSRTRGRRSARASSRPCPPCPRRGSARRARDP